MCEPWNSGHVPKFASGPPKEDLNIYKKQSDNPATANIKWEFDPYTSLYFFRKPITDDESYKANQEPVKQTDSMVVFSLTKK